MVYNEENSVGADQFRRRGWRKRHRRSDAGMNQRPPVAEGRQMKKIERFEVILKEGSNLTETGQMMILVDKETGVNYL